MYVLKEHVRLAGCLWGRAGWDASLLERWVPCLGVRLLGELCVEVCTWMPVCTFTLVCLHAYNFTVCVCVHPCSHMCQ